MNRRRSRRKVREVPDLDITTFLNLMVVLVPFLLISAVFSRVTILELSVPTAAAPGAAVNRPDFNIEVIVRENGLEFGNGARVVAAIPNKDDDYDLEKLSQMLMSLKSTYPDKEDATVLMEPDIEYNSLVRVMDTVRSATLRAEEGDVEAEVENAGENPEETVIVLFPNISIGDAP